MLALKHVGERGRGSGNKKPAEAGRCYSDSGFMNGFEYPFKSNVN